MKYRNKLLIIITLCFFTVQCFVQTIADLHLQLDSVRKGNFNEPLKTKRVLENLTHYAESKG